ncbi:uncharacterized protein F5147DRAFT_637578 [Suillus discolor]|uniref:Uncharacterized protein n=1 Tax=Suillus discolor TaxID=1912936 RepID=A0A9P7F573_9AGAM|nr:uncharacterized protein F5147DRAFT_637578 [Suillus discolor]KAG2106623.1 hypothetical protein F5147DRAFT_637578 [Suillus discolor]
MASVARDALMISDETEARGSLSFPPVMIVEHKSYQWCQLDLPGPSISTDTVCSVSFSYFYLSIQV